MKKVWQIFFALYICATSLHAGVGYYISADTWVEGLSKILATGSPIKSEDTDSLEAEKGQIDLARIEVEKQLTDPQNRIQAISIDLAARDEKLSKMESERQQRWYDRVYALGLFGPRLSHRSSLLDLLSRRP